MAKKKLPPSVRRTLILNIPLNKIERVAIRKRAAAANMTPTGFARWMALCAAIPGVKE